MRFAMGYYGVDVIGVCGGAVGIFITEIVIIGG